MKKRNMLCIFLSALLFINCSSESENEIQSYFDSGISGIEFDKYLESEMKSLRIPGLAVAVINKGKVVHHKTIGYANVEKKLPVTGKTIFEGASLSKSVFAFFVMKYVEEGKLDLDKSLYEYLPYPDIAYDERYKKITARMVLSHRTGFPNWRRDEEDQKLKIKFEPGTDYEYSGEGYQYLAMVLKSIDDTDWHGLEKTFQNKVARPTGLEHTVFIQTSYTRTHKAEPYDENVKRIDKTENDEFGAAYSIHSEPIDFSRWMIAVMKKEQLTEMSYLELFRPHSNVSSGLVDILYCLGYMTPRFPFVDTDIYLHTGHNDGFTCWYALDTEKDWGFVLFTNSENGERLGEKLFFYLMLGGVTRIYVISSLLAIIITGALVCLTRFVIQRWRMKPC